MDLSHVEPETLVMMATDLLDARRHLEDGDLEKAKPLVREVYSACYDLLTGIFGMEEAYP